MALKLAKRFAAVFLSAAMIITHQTPALLWAAEHAVLEGIEVQPDQVTLHLTERVRYNTFVTAEPPRLVIELLNTEYGAAARRLEGQGTLLKRVRSGQYQREPSLISRIVMDLKKLAMYRAKWVDSRLLVTLMTPAGEASGASTPAEAAIPKKKPAAPAAKKAVKKAPKPKAPVPVERPRITRRIVSEAPPKPAPKPAAAPAPKPAAKPAAAPAPKPAAKPAAAPAPKPVRVARAPKPRISRRVSAPPAPARAAAPVIPSAEMPRSMSTRASAELRDYAMGRRTRSRRPRKARSAEKEGPKTLDQKSRRDIMATLPTDPITLDFDEMGIGDILNVMSQKAKINIVYGADVTGTMTLHLVDVPFNEAFTTILSMQGLVTNQVGENILRVMTPTTLKKERSVAVSQTRIIRLKYVKADEVKTAIDAVRTAEGRSGSIVIDANTNSLIVTDTLDGIAGVERLLSELDVRPLQVLIETKLVEVQLTKDMSYGIQWDYSGVQSGKVAGQEGTNIFGDLSHPAATNSPNVQPLDQNANSVLSDATGRGTGVILPATNIFGAFTFGRVTNNYFLSATLTAAASQGKAKVLSDPKITTMNGKKAKIDITTSIPFVTTETTPTSGSVTTTEKVEYQETGITLEVTPTVNADGRVTLEVKPTVSQPSATAAAAGSTGAIATDKREADTVVMVQDGETIVIGGLITDRVTNNVAKVPLLGDIPIIGWLFKKKSVDRRRVELLIFVTTKIIPS